MPSIALRNAETWRGASVFSSPPERPASQAQAGKPARYLNSADAPTTCTLSAPVVVSFPPYSTQRRTRRQTAALRVRRRCGRRYGLSNNFARYRFAAFHSAVLTFTQPLRAPDR
jgi:hypothetical protein